MQYGSTLAIQCFILLVAYLNHNWPLALCGFLFGIFALLFPPLARRIDQIWGWIGRTLARIVNPITLSILFIFMICPFGLFARWMKWLNPAFRSNKDSQLITVNICPSKKSFSKPF